MAPSAECIGVSNESEIWMEGWGWFARVRGILLTAGSKFGAAAFAAATHHPHWAAGIGVVALFSVIFLVSVRFYLLQAARITNRYHCLAHDLRDDLNALHEESRHGQLSRLFFEYFNRRAATNIAGFYHSFSRNNLITCAIYLADMEDGKEVYVLHQCSHGSEPARGAPPTIPSTAGLMKKFQAEPYNGMGVVLIRNIKDAVTEGWWLSQPSAGQLTPVKSLMVSPINGYSRPAKAGAGKKMLGLLMITSPKTDLRRVHADSLKGHADLLGMAYPVIYRLSKESAHAPLVPPPQSAVGNSAQYLG